MKNKKSTAKLENNDLGEEEHDKLVLQLGMINSKKEEIGLL